MFPRQAAAAGAADSVAAVYQIARARAKRDRTAGIGQRPVRGAENLL